MTMTNQSLKKITGPSIVFTDLDGTLLDHDDYSWYPAQSTLEKLEQNNIPVIFNTSKTRAELEFWRTETNNKHPFIVENGSAIFIPRAYPDNKPNETHYDVIQLGIDRHSILSWLTNDCDSFTGDFIHFAQLSTEELVHITDLPSAQAKLALKREYSEAIQWLGNTERKAEFTQHAINSGYKVLIGGRFIHILGKTDKGAASQKLYDYLQPGLFTEEDKINSNDFAATTIACGDSDNDIEMLNWADIAVVVRSPHREPPKVDNSQVILSEHYGPKGWAETLINLLF